MDLPGSPGSKKAYLGALLRDRNDLDALLGLAAVYLADGELDAAMVVATRAATRHSEAVAAHVMLGSVLLERDDLVGARSAFLAAVGRDRTSRSAWAGLGVVFERSGELAAADVVWRHAFAAAEPARSAYRGGDRPVRILLLWSAVDGNIALRPILDDRIFQWSTLFVESFASGVVLPQHDVVFNAFGNPDLRTRALDCAERVVRASGAPVINHPQRVRASGRLAIADRLRGLPGVLTPHVVPVAREVLLGADAVRVIAAAGFTWPFLVRSPGYHNGQHFEAVEDPERLRRIVSELPGDELLLISFIDTRDAAGAVRKYRVLSIDGRLYPLHLAISQTWKVRYFSADPRPQYRDEERAFLDDMHATLGDAALAALERIAAVLALDYGGIDFTVDAAGRVVVFEANATMTIVRPREGEGDTSRRAAANRAIDAVRALIVARAARGAVMPRARG